MAYAYDNNGNIETLTDANGTITREYDALNRIKKYTDTQGNVLLYDYDTVGNLEVVTYPDNRTVIYGYDDADQLIKVTDWDNRVTEYGYDKNGRLISTLRPNGTLLTRTYDDAGQLEQQQDIVVATNEVISQFNFSYDKAGNIIQELVVPQPKPPQLTLPTSMTYDMGNLLKTYNEQLVEFDADGNIVFGPLNGNIEQFEFDSRNRLVNAGGTVYQYDAENQRVGVDDTRYVVNSMPALSQVLVQTKGNGEVTYYIYGLGLIGEARTGNYFSYHFDYRGSTVALSDGSGQVVERFQYSPYGLLMYGDSSATPFLFNGMYGVMSDANGLYYMRARFYSSEIRRFVNRDILIGNVAEGQTLNRFAFVTGRPVSFIDPLGLTNWWFLGGRVKNGSSRVIIAVQWGDGEAVYLLHPGESSNPLIDIDYLIDYVNGKVQITKIRGMSYVLIKENGFWEMINSYDLLKDFLKTKKKFPRPMKKKYIPHFYNDVILDSIEHLIKYYSILDYCPIPSDLPPIYLIK